MPSGHLAQLILAVVAEAIILHCLSRILFVWVLQAVVTRGHGGGWLVKLLRLPGNFVHELGHAIGYLACGFRVKHLVLCVADAEGRGACQAGRPWHPLAFPAVATATAAVLPLFVGTAVLAAVARLLNIPLLEPKPAGDAGPLLSLWDAVRETLYALDFHDWRTYAFLYLGFSIGAELSPSDTDFRKSAGPLMVVGGVAIALVVYAGHYHAGTDFWRWLSHAIAATARALHSLLIIGILTTSVVAVLAVLPALAWRALRVSLRSRL